MIRWVSVRTALVVLLFVSATASAQQKYAGGGLAYNIDAPDSSFGLAAAAWLPVKGPNTPFKPLIIVPKFTDMFGLDYWQLDVDALWDIPTTGTGNIHPYIGMGVGVNRADYGGQFSDTTPLLNFDAGVRYKKPDSKMQFLIETHYSSGLDYGNTMHLNLVVLLPFGK